jgi:two-component system LytT family sensor kinase
MAKDQNYKRWSYYILFAISFGFVWYLFKLGGTHNPIMALYSDLIDIVFSSISLILTVEILLPGLFCRRRYLLFGLTFIGTIAVTGSLIIMLQLRLMGYSILEYNTYILRYKEHYYYWFWSDLVFGSYFLIAFISLGGFSIRLLFDRILSEKQLEKAEKEKIESELEMHKNQINKHFLFNALNTIYYKIDRVNAPARLMVEQFSSLLHYQLYECNNPVVSIENEMNFITDYIEIQRERFNNELKIVYADLKNAKDFSIAPFILMPLVENCFKHVSQFKDKENLIVIKCKKELGCFYFSTMNTVAPVKRNDAEGIGLVNVRDRLNIIYHAAFNLETENAGEIFKLDLKINVE